MFHRLFTSTFVLRYLSTVKMIISSYGCERFVRLNLSCLFPFFWFGEGGKSVRLETMLL